MKPLPSKVKTWPLDLIDTDPAHGSMRLQVNHLNHKTVPAGIAYTAFIEPTKDGLELVLQNKARNANSPILNFFYTITYPGKEPFYLGPMSINVCSYPLGFSSADVPKLELNQY